MKLISQRILGKRCPLTETLPAGFKNGSFRGEKRGRAGGQQCTLPLKSCIGHFLLGRLREHQSSAVGQRGRRGGQVVKENLQEAENGFNNIQTRIGRTNN